MKNFKKYLNESIEVTDITARLNDVATALDKLATRDAMHLADRIFEFIDMHEYTGLPEGELKSIKDDVIHYAKKWGHIKMRRPTDRLGELVLGLRNPNPNDAPIDIDEPNIEMEDVMESFIPEEAEYDYGTDDYYDPDSKTFKKMPVEFVDKGKADLNQKTNNPRYGDNSLEDITVNESEDNKEHFSSKEEWNNALEKYYPDASVHSVKDRQENDRNFRTFIARVAGKNQVDKNVWDDKDVGEFDTYNEEGWIIVPGNLNEDLSVDENLKLDELQSLLNDAGISDNEIIAGIAGLKPEAKSKVAMQLGVPEKHVDFMINELSTKLSHADEKNYSLFTESYYANEYRKIFEEDDRFGYQEDSLGNVSINDTLTGKSKYIEGTEAQDLLRKIFSNPNNTQKILSNYENLMEEKKEKPKNWKAAGPNNPKELFSKQIKEKEDEKPKDLSDKKPPFANTIKIKKKIKETIILDEETDFLTEIHSNDSGSYNFPWKSGALTGTGTAFFSVKNDEPVIKLISVRDDNGDEIEDYNHDDVLEQAKKFIPEA